MSDWYWKDGTRAVTADFKTDLKNWQRQMHIVENHLTDFNYKVVKQTVLPNKKWVSTVWLGLDHGYGEGLPLIFETMVFSEKEGGESLWQDRYSTLEEAEQGHEEVCKEWSKK